LSWNQQKQVRNRLRKKEHVKVPLHRAAARNLSAAFSDLPGIMTKRFSYAFLAPKSSESPPKPLRTYGRMHSDTFARF